MRLNEQLADVLSSRFATALLAELTSVFYLVVMFVYSPILGLIALSGPLLVIVLVWRITLLRSEVRQRQAREASAARAAAARTVGNGAQA